MAAYCIAQKDSMDEKDNAGVIKLKALIYIRGSYKYLSGKFCWQQSMCLSVKTFAAMSISQIEPGLTVQPRTDLFPNR